MITLRISDTPRRLSQTLPRQTAVDTYPGCPALAAQRALIQPVHPQDARHGKSLKLTRFSGHLIKSVPLMEEVFNEQVRAREFRDASRTLSCHQDIAADGFFSLGMIAEFAEPMRRNGAWFYRNLFWEAGMVGQILYLEAEAAGVRSTGMGCYFDEPVHQVLGLAENQFQSLYHFTVGVPLEDHRLRTWPPYSARSRKRDANSRS